MRRFFALALVSCLFLLGAAPQAQARWGHTPVDTWARYGDRIVGHNGGSGPLKVWAPTGSARRVIWSVANLGGVTPRVDSVTFHGCADAHGFRFRYSTPDGTDVTYAATHGGYAAKASPHERAWVNVGITSTKAARSVTCELSGVANGLPDTVKIWAHS
jgi:hypothetical protein